MKNIFTFAAATLLLLSVGAAQAANVVVIGNGAGESKVSSTDARDMFLGRKTLWANGAKVRVCLLRGIPADDPFYATLLDKDERQFNAYWVRRLFSGNGVPPTMVTSSKELGDFLGANPGAICYAGSDILAGVSPAPKSHALP
jgi:hypothetical protein